MASRKEAFTPGPWAVIQSGLHGDSWLVCEDVPGHLRPVCATEHGHPKAEANARLIAAAPDLYNAVLLALESLQVGGVFPLSVQPHLRAALSKASDPIPEGIADGRNSEG